MAASYQHLRAFHAIAIEGGVSRAARRLNVSQPTLSQQLKTLEARHGVMLFESRRAPLRLTDAGRELLTLTTKLFAAAADIDDMFGERVSLTGGTLRLGSDNPVYAAHIVDRFRRQHPTAEIRVRVGNAREVLVWLGEAQIDGALASDPPGDPAFSYEPFANDLLACAIPADHPFAELSAVPVAMLARETLLLREPNSKTRAFTERVLEDSGVRPAGTIELQGRETIREAIALGLGVSLFFSSECPPDDRILYRPLAAGGRDYELRSYLVCRADRSRSALMRALHAIAADMRATSNVYCTRAANDPVHAFSGRSTA